MEMERKFLICRVKRTFHLQKSEQEKWSMNPVLGHQSGHRLPALGNGTKLEGGTGGVATSSSLPLSNVCAPWARLQRFLKMLVLYSECWAPLPSPPQKANAVKKPETKS